MDRVPELLSLALSLISVAWIVWLLMRGRRELVVFAVVPGMASVLIPSGGAALSAPQTATLLIVAAFMALVPLFALKLGGTRP